MMMGMVRGEAGRFGGTGQQLVFGSVDDGLTSDGGQTTVVQRFQNL